MHARSRREFVTASTLGLAAATSRAGTQLPRRTLGKTGLEVSVIGLGGARIGQMDDGRLATDVVRRCYDLGINYFDTAAAGAYGLSQRRYGQALHGLRDKIVLATKTRHRTLLHARLDLEQSLGALRTDYVDLYQVHNVIDDSDIQFIFGPKGLMEMIEKARQEGKIRFVGVTGHTDPAVMNRIVSRYEFDSILIPLSVTDGARAGMSFEKQTLPVARAKGMGIIAMKTLGVGRILQEKVATLDEALGYVLSLPVATAIMGCDQIPHVEAAVEIGRRAQPLKAEEMQRLRRAAAAFDLAGLEPWKARSQPRAYRAD